MNKNNNMLNILPIASTQTHTSSSLPRVKLVKGTSNFRKSSTKPYYYSSTGEICSNAATALITCTTSPHNPLKYRPIGSKIEPLSLVVKASPSKTKNRIKDCSFLRQTMAKMQSSLTYKEIFVTDGTTIDSKLLGFYYKIRRITMTRNQKQENLESFLKICKENLTRNKRFRYLFSVHGKIYQFLQDIPYTEKILVISQDLEFSGLDLANPEDHLPPKPLNSFFIPVHSSSKNPKYPLPQNQSQKLNPNYLKVKLGQTAVKIDTEFPKLFDLGMENLRKKCHFSEADLHKLYAKYKMLVHLSTAKDPNHNIFSGISREVFIESYQGTKELNFVLSRIFDCIDIDRSGTIDWNEYLSAMEIMMNGNFEQQIDLFFQVYDTDGNGVLSFKEIQELCKLQLQKSDADNVIDELAFSFASLIFDITEIPYDKEIPAGKIKEALGKQGDKSLVEMFCSFSFLKIR